MPDLTPKQARFVEEFLIDLNATQAAIRAGYSKKTASEQGYDNLRKPQIAEAVAEAQVERSERTKITVDNVLRELALIGFANAGEYFDWGPDGVKLKPKEDLTPEQQAVVAEVSETVTEKGRTIRLKLHDKRGALVDVGRHLGMFPSKHEHSGPDGKPIEVSDLEFARRLAFAMTKGVMKE